jgi:hypothetical protein
MKSEEIAGRLLVFILILELPDQRFVKQETYNVSSYLKGEGYEAGGPITRCEVIF